MVAQFSPKNKTRQNSALGGLAVLIAFSTLGLGGCSSMNSSMESLTKLNFFKEKEEILPGERVAVLKPSSPETTASNIANDPIQLPAMVANANWSQPGGSQNNAPGHLNYRGGGANVWYKSVGYGSSSRGKLTASPIVYQGRIFTLDTQANVSAFSTNGSLVWRKSFVPANEGAKEGFGGGLATVDGQVILATGFGEVFALNPANGAQQWKAKLGSPVRSSPTAGNGKVFVVSTEGKLHCLSASTGSEIWTRRGGRGRTRLLDNASPAIDGKYVAVPYPSGEVIAYDMETGGVVTSESLSRSRSKSSLAAIANPARPALSNGVLYAVGHAGKMVATSLRTGERLWTHKIRSKHMPWVAGNMVYVVDVHGKLYAINAKSGGLKWARNMPADGGKWAGPVLAGNKLWLTSSKGMLVGADVQSGAVQTKRVYGQTTNQSPIIAGGKLYVLTERGNLMAFN